MKLLFYDLHQLRWWLSTWPHRRACWRASLLYRRVYHQVMHNYYWGEDHLWTKIPQIAIGLAGSLYVFIATLIDLFAARLGHGPIFALHLILRIVGMLVLWAIAHLGFQDLETPLISAHQKAYDAVQDERKAATATSTFTPSHRP